MLAYELVHRQICLFGGPTKNTLRVSWLIGSLVSLAGGGGGEKSHGGGSTGHRRTLGSAECDSARLALVALEGQLPLHVGGGDLKIRRRLPSLAGGFCGCRGGGKPKRKEKKRKEKGNQTKQTSSQPLLCLGCTAFNFHRKQVVGTKNPCQETLVAIPGLSLARKRGRNNLPDRDPGSMIPSRKQKRKQEATTPTPKQTPQPPKGGQPWSLPRPPYFRIRGGSSECRRSTQTLEKANCLREHRICMSDSTAKES